MKSIFIIVFVYSLAQTVVKENRMFLTCGDFCNTVISVKLLFIHLQFGTVVMVPRQPSSSPSFMCLSFYLFLTKCFIHARLKTF